MWLTGGATEEEEGEEQDVTFTPGEFWEAVLYRPINSPPLFFLVVVVGGGKNMLTSLRPVARQDFQRLGRGS